MTIERRVDGMRHSSSWPDRMHRTVRVRVDPLSRAFTIIPTSRETLYRSEETAPRSNRPEEVVPLDRCGEIVKMKRRLVDDGPALVDEKSHPGNRYFMSRSLSSTNVIHRMNDAPNAFRDQIRCKSDILVAPRCAKRASEARRMDVVPERDEDRRSEAFDVVVNVADQRPRIVQINGNSREARRHNASPPQIEIVDYDDYVTSFVLPRRHHACSKCTSEDDLRSLVDPFRSPSQGKKNDGARRRDDSYGRKKSRAERQGKDTWYEERLISAARNEDGKKPTERLADLRKEATLKRHYYPEGGWGYVIVTCSMLVHFLGVGLQLAAPGTWHSTAELQFLHPPLHSADLATRRQMRCRGMRPILYREVDLKRL
ncbi:PREDICTED: uncharacterized protein LOC106747046 [Dinoponera quadriceps]|uniref:Uncharacterized protein LOC106747046 n=1 Tax=Dinoponera quadriceps TaxID=609295 RepID=A0A6P3XP46_DINQU|nr:PREDICTED: uncharacterized protein LOC106747046 [Dinoponera quadriceps]